MGEPAFGDVEGEGADVGGFEVACHTGFEVLALLGCEGVGLGEEWDDIGELGEAAEVFDVYGFYAYFC